MRHLLLACGLTAAGICSAYAQTPIVVFEEDFEGAAAGATADTNATIPGTEVQARNGLTGTVVDLNDAANATLAAGFSAGSGKVLSLSDAGRAFAVLESAGALTDFGTVLPTDEYTISFDVFIPAGNDPADSNRLRMPVANIRPNMRLQPSEESGPILINDPLIETVGQFQVVLTGPVSEISDGSATIDSAFPQMRFNQNISNNVLAPTENLAFIDNISFTVTPAAVMSPVVRSLELGLNGAGVGESVAYLFTAGDETAESVYTPENREIFFDVDGVSSVTLLRDGALEQMMAVTSPASGVFTPQIPTAPGTYIYTLEAAEGMEVVTSEEIVIHVDQPYDIAVGDLVGGSLLSTLGNLRYNLDFDGDHDQDVFPNSIVGTFSIEGIAGTVSIEELIDPLEGLLAEPDAEFSRSYSGLPLEVNLQTVLTAFEDLDTAQEDLVFPLELTAVFTIENQAGIATTEEITVTVDETGIFAEVDPANFVDGTIPNTYSGQFTEATMVSDPVANTNTAVTFPTVVEGGFLLGSGEFALPAGFRTQDATISLWVEIPDAPTGNIILDLGATDGAGTVLGFQDGELVARIQTTEANASTVRTPISAGWHHIALLLDLTDGNQVSVAIDGGAPVSGDAATDPINNWFGGAFAAAISTMSFDSFVGATSGELPENVGLNSRFGHLRAFSGLLDSAAIQDLSQEFRGVTAPEGIVLSAVTLKNGEFSVTASGLDSGTDYYLLRNTDLDGRPDETVQFLSAGSDTETFVDSAPPEGRAFYVVSDTEAP